ncbi:hypothetical protein Tco_0025594 [Tanacetum coccineum]
MLTECSDVIRYLLRGVRIQASAIASVIVYQGGDDSDDGDGGGEGDGVGEGEQVLLQGGATIGSSMIASMEGKRVYGARTVFLGVNMKQTSLEWSLNGWYEGVYHGWIIEVCTVGAA